MADLTAKLTQALADLGPDADTVAAVLRLQGCRGIRRAAGSCPVAEYLRRQGFTNPTVATWVVVDDALTPTPWPVYRFIGTFDARVYPDLIAEEATP